MYIPIVIRKDPDSCYGVEVPDVPGCFSAGDTFEEAVKNAIEAIQFHLLELDEPFEIQPSTLASLSAKYIDEKIVFVEID